MILSPRESGEYISSKAQHVTLHESGIKNCAKEFVTRVTDGRINIGKLFKGHSVHPNDANEKAVNWVFFTDTLNFSFWNIEGSSDPQYLVTYKGETFNGYMSMCAAIDRTLDQGIPLTDPNYYCSLTEEKLNDFLMGDNDVPCPMIKERVECLKEVSKVLNEKYNGTFINCLKECNQSAVKLLEMVIMDFPCFRDVAEYEGQKVAFYKRAQILVGDLWSLFNDQGLGNFPDIAEITMFADYRIPQSLQYFGAMSYSSELMDVLKADTILKNGSQFEVEIRGCSIEATERIVAEARMLLSELNHSAKDIVNAVFVDHFTWGFRREKAVDMVKFPYHKVRSIYY